MLSPISSATCPICAWGRQIGGRSSDNRTRAVSRPFCELYPGEFCDHEISDLFAYDVRSLMRLVQFVLGESLGVDKLAAAVRMLARVRFLARVRAHVLGDVLEANETLVALRKQKESMETERCKDDSAKSGHTKDECKTSFPHFTEKHGQLCLKNQSFWFSAEKMKR
jgi:hypothetical protein